VSESVWIRNFQDPNRTQDTRLPSLSDQKSIRLIGSFKQGEQKAKGRTETGSLKDDGYEAFHPPLIRSVLVGKLLDHEFFLVA
jgi:hypothetical protein